MTTETQEHAAAAEPPLQQHFTALDLMLPLSKRERLKRD